MKKILLLLLLATFSIQAQTLQNPTYGNVKLKNNTTDNSATKVNVQSTDGTINTISKSDLVNVVEVNDVPSLPLTGVADKIYVVKNVNKIYRWNGTFYQELAGSDLTYQSVIDALGFTPENVANKATDFTTVNNTLYPTTKAVDDTFVNKADTEGIRLGNTLTPIYAWGDSLTAGAGSTVGLTYPFNLATLTNFTVTNKGIGGETSTQIKDRLIADSANYSKSVIIWVGRNNYTSPETVKADIATMVSTIGHTRYLVVGIINGNYASEYINQTGWNQINQLNLDLKALYGDKFVDIRPYLVSLHNQTAQDLIDFANDIPPLSLRSDNIHLNNTGYLKVAEFINKKLGNLYNRTEYLQSKDFGYYSNKYSILNQTSIQQSAGFSINGTGISNNIITRAGTNVNNNATHHVFQTSFSNRIAFSLTGAESGSNTGSNLSLIGYSDAGSVITNGLTFFRATGNIVLQNGISVPTDTGYRLDVNGTFRTQSTVTLGGYAPTTSAGTYDILTRNSSTGVVEKVDRTTFATTDSPSLTGTPTAPTPTIGTNTTQIATTAFVTNGIATADSQNVKLTGDQTISGQKSFSLTGKIDMQTDNAFPAIMATTLGSNGKIAAQFINNSSSPNSTALMVQTLSGGVGNRTLSVSNYTSTGTGIVSNASNGGVSISSQSGDGDSYVSNITFQGAGRNYVGKYNGTETYSVDKTGNVLGNSYIKRSTPANNILLAGGGDLAQNTAFNKNFGTTAGTVVEGGTLGSNAYSSTAYELAANKATNLTSPDNIKFPTTLTVANALSGYLPLSGGTLSGSVIVNNGFFQKFSNSAPVALMTSSNAINAGSTTDFNTYVYGNNPYNIWTNGVKRVTVDGSGNVDFTGTMKMKEYTVATLPTPTGTAYATVTDALAPTYMATVVGGGAVVTPVFYNGTAWVSH